MLGRVKLELAEYEKNFDLWPMKLAALGQHAQ